MGTVWLVYDEFALFFFLFPSVHGSLTKLVNGKPIEHWSMLLASTMGWLFFLLNNLWEGNREENLQLVLVRIVVGRHTG